LVHEGVRFTKTFSEAAHRLAAELSIQSSRWGVPVAFATVAPYQKQIGVGKAWLYHSINQVD
jgi:hypothetical protein